MEVAVAIIGAAAVISAAIITGLCSRSRTAKTLQKIEILEKRIAAMKNSGLSSCDEKAKKEQRLIDHLNDSINRDIYEIAGSSTRTIVATAISLVSICLGLAFFIFAINTEVSSEILVWLVLFLMCLIVFCGSVYVDLIPRFIELAGKKQYQKFLDGSN